MQTEGGEEDLPESKNPADDDNMDDTTHSSDSTPSERKDTVHEISLVGRDTGYDDQDS